MIDGRAAYVVASLPATIVRERCLYMTAEELLLDETRAWMARARSDLESAEGLANIRKYGDALFFCQQAAEKALKAFLTFHQTPFRKTHYLRDLVPDCIDGSLRPTLDSIDSLSEYAWRFRYPAAPYEPEAAEAARAFQLAEVAVREIDQRLPPAA